MVLRMNPEFHHLCFFEFVTLKRPAGDRSA